MAVLWKILCLAAWLQSFPVIPGSLGGSGMYLLFPVNCCFQTSVTGIILQHNSSTSLGCGSRQNSTLLSPNSFTRNTFSMKGINHTRYMRSHNMKCLASKCRGTIKSGFWMCGSLCWNGSRGVWSQHFVGNSLTEPSLLKNSGLGPVFSLKHLGLTAFFQAQGRNSSDIFVIKRNGFGSEILRPQFPVWSRTPCWAPGTPGFPTAASAPPGVSTNAERNIGFQSCQDFRKLGLVWFGQITHKNKITFGVNCPVVCSV